MKDRCIYSERVMSKAVSRIRKEYTVGGVSISSFLNGLDTICSIQLQLLLPVLRCTTGSLFKANSFIEYYYIVQLFIFICNVVKLEHLKGSVKLQYSTDRGSSHKVCRCHLMLTINL